MDITFLFISDIHACRMASGVNADCARQGKTDSRLLRHVSALNRLPGRRWPADIDGAKAGLASAGQEIVSPLGIVVGGDMTDDGGGQVVNPGEGSQLRQFSQRYQQGMGPDRVNFPVYTGLGNHDLDQDGPPPHVDWYRRELRDYVSLNHRPSVFFKPAVPAGNYDYYSDCYSWDWGGLHLVQLHRFPGDTRKGAISCLPWLKSDLASYAGDGRPVIVFQHYGWDTFSIEAWSPELKAFDPMGSGPARWWGADEREAALAALENYNVIGLFHGHEHNTPMIYRQGGIDLFKPKAAFLGGFALVRVTDSAFDLALGEAAGDDGEVIFTGAFSKTLL